MKLTVNEEKIKKPDMMTLKGLTIPLTFDFNGRYKNICNIIHRDNMTDEEHFKEELYMFNGFMGIITWIQGRMDFGEISLIIFGNLSKEEREKKIKEFIDYFCYYFQFKGSNVDRHPADNIYTIYNFLKIYNESKEIINYFRESVTRVFLTKIDKITSNETYNNKIKEFLNQGFLLSNEDSDDIEGESKRVLALYTNRIYKNTIGKIVSKDISYEFQEVCFELWKFAHECSLDLRNKKELEDLDEEISWKQFFEHFKEKMEEKNISDENDIKKIITILQINIFGDEIFNYMKTINQLMNVKSTPNVIHFVEAIFNVCDPSSIYKFEDCEFSFTDLLLIGNNFRGDEVPFYKSVEELNFFDTKERENLLIQLLSSNIDLITSKFDREDSLSYNGLSEAFHPSELFTKREGIDREAILNYQAIKIYLIGRSTFNPSFNKSFALNADLKNAAKDLSQDIYDLGLDGKSKNRKKYIENFNIKLDSLNEFIAGLPNNIKPSSLDRNEWYCFMKKYKEYWKWVKSLQNAILRLRESKMYWCIFFLSYEFYMNIINDSKNLWLYEDECFFDFRLFTVYRLLNCEKLKEKSKKILFNNKISGKKLSVYNNFKIYLDKVLELFIEHPSKDMKFWFDHPHDNIRTTLFTQNPTRQIISLDNDELEKRLKDCKIEFIRSLSYKDYFDLLINYTKKE